MKTTLRLRPVATINPSTSLRVKSIMLTAVMLVAFAAFKTAEAQTPVAYTLNLNNPGTAFGDATAYASKTGTVNGVQWDINVASVQSSGVIFLGWNNATNRALGKLSLATRGSALATALGIDAISDTGRIALVGLGNIADVDSINIRLGAGSSAGTVTIRCLYTTDGGNTYTVLPGTLSGVGASGTFIPPATIPNAQYAFVLTGTANTVTYRGAIITFYEKPPANAPTATPDQSSLAFAYQETSKTFDLTFANLTGPISLTSSNSSVFSVSPSQILADATSPQTVTVTFNPTDRRNYTGNITIDGGGLTTPVTVALSGTNYPPMTVFAGWEVNGLPVNTPYPFSATTNDASISKIPALTLGSGVAMATSNPGANHMPIVLTGQATATEAEALTNNTYWEFALTPAEHTTLDIEQINVNLRRTASGPNGFRFFYSTDNFATAGIPIGNATTHTGSGSDGSAFVFDNLFIADVTSTITFRLYVWGGTYVASNSSNTISIGRLDGDDLEISGYSVYAPPPPTPELTVVNANIDGNLLDFRETFLGTPLTETITVSGINLTGNITYTLTDNDDAAYSIAEGNSGTVANGGTLTITFDPTVEGEYRSLLTFTSDGAEDVELELFGKAEPVGTPVFRFHSRTAHNFGNVLVNETGTAYRLVLDTANLNGAAITFRSIAPDFSINDDKKDTIFVNFTPQSSGVKDIKLYAEVVGTDLIDSVELSGTGVVTTLTAVPNNELDFEEVAVTKTKTIDVTVNATFLIGDVTLTISGTNAAMFTIDSTTFVNPANNTLTNKIAKVTYTPTDTFAHTATLTISTAGDVADVVINLIGKGKPLVFFEDFETMTTGAGSYAGALATFATGQWWVRGMTTMDGNDRRNGARSVRLRGTNAADTANANSIAGNYVEMRFDKPNGAGVLTFKYASYSTHSGGQLQVQYSTDGGTTWENRGAVITAPAWDAAVGMLTANVLINKAGDIRIRIMKLQQAGSTTVNIDDIEISDCLTPIAFLDLSGNGNFGTPFVGGEIERTFTVTGEELTGNITYNITGTDAAAFTISEKTWNTATGGTLEVTFKPTIAKEYNATLVISSPGAENASVELTATAYPSSITVSNIAEFKAEAGNETSPTEITITGDLTFVFRNGRNFYVEDATGGLLIDNNANIITGTYTEGDVISGGISGTLTMYRGLRQFVPTANIATGAAGSPVTPTVVTMEDLLADFDRYESMLVKLEVVNFLADGTFGTSSSGGNMTIEQDGNTMIARNHFNGFTGYQVKESATYDITGFAIPYIWQTDDQRQIAPRNASDIKEILKPGLYVDRTSIAFGNQDTNTTSNAQTIVVTGVELTEAIHGEIELELRGENASYFKANVDDDWNILEGGIIHVTFTPATVGAKTATLHIISGEFEQTITLTGTGVDPIGSSIGKKELETALVLYPNPVKDMLYIQAEQAIAKIEILSLSGQLVAQQNGDKNSMNVSNLANGTYIIRITFDNGVTLSRVIVK